MIIRPTSTYERAILGAILLDDSCLGSVLTQLQDRDFNHPTLRAMFRICRELFSNGTPVDPVVVLHAGAGVFGPDLLTQLMDTTPSASNVLHHCRALKETNILNQLGELGGRLAEEEATLDAAREVISQINGLLAHRQSAGISSAAQAAAEFLRRHDPDAPKPEYIPLGFAPLNQIVRAAPGDFIVLGGLPSSGKTLMCLQMALAIAEKYRVGIFSLETSREKLTDRLIAHLARLPLGKIQMGDLGEADWAAVAQATAKLSALPIDIISAAGMRFDDVQAMTLSRQYQVVMIDYLQLIASPEKDRYTAVTKISMQVHTMCQQHGIACIGLSQLTRPEKQRGKPVPPDMSSLRESGQLEQDADVIVLIYAADPNDNKSNRIVKIAKNKEGSRGRFELHFDGATQTLTPVAEIPGQHYYRLQKEIRAAGKTAPGAEWVQQAMQGTPLPF